jgi:hypothetical protein
MTVSSTTKRNSYTGDGSTTTFAYSFKIFDDDDITVILRTTATGTETVQTKTTHYSVTGVGSTSGGNVVFGSAPTSAQTVVLLRQTAQTQATDYTPNDPFPAASHEDALDKLTLMAQDQQDELDRTIKLSRTNTMTSTEFTVGATDRANKVLGFDGSGELTVTQELGTFRGDFAASTSYSARDIIRDTSTGNIFIVNEAHTSSGSEPLTSNANSAKYTLLIESATAGVVAGTVTASRGVIVDGNKDITGFRNITLSGELTLGSGAVINEAELEAIDGVTAGTVAASKAVVVDSNKDAASFRNITLTGELDAGSLDVSGDADIDGTLEADAITVNGTALNTVIAGVTVTDATNSAHVLVTDNESTNEENLITFVEDATSSTGNVGLEMDGNLTYNPSTGTVTATVFKGNIDAVDGDFDGTLEADAMTLNGTAITATATLDTGISNNNVPKFTSGVADNDFLRVDGTAIEGRSASEVLSDIAAAPAAGDSNIVTTGALNSGSITSGFGAIDNGSSNITTTGVGSFGSLDISGDIDVDGTTNLDVVDIDGALTQDGGAVFNEASADVDFRVESDNLDDALFVQGSDGIVGVGTKTPAVASGYGMQIHNDSSAQTRLVMTNSDTGSAGTDGFQIVVHTDTGAILELRESADLRFATGATERMRLTSAGKIGIGTASPSEPLHVSGTSGAAAVFERTDSASVGIRLLGNGMSASTAPKISAESGPDMAFTVNNGERMRIDSTGNLGIGTTSPAAGLDVRRGLNGNSQFLVDDSTTGGSGAGGAFLKFMGSNATAEQIAGIDGSMTNGTDGSESGILAFFTMNSGTSAEKFRIASNGDLTATDTSIASNSDQRIKENISDFAYDLDKFKELKTRTFDWKQPTLHGEKSGVRGFVAQELEAIDSYWVSEIEVASNSDDYQYLPDTTVTDDSNNQRVARFAKTSKLGQKDAMYVSVIQQLIAKIETLEAKVAALEE